MRKKLNAESRKSLLKNINIRLEQWRVVYRRQDAKPWTSHTDNHSQQTEYKTTLNKKQNKGYLWKNDARKALLIAEQR